jgi:hypothetical protein
VQGSYEANCNASGGWETAEKHSRNANRTNAIFLNDEAIASRKPLRDIQKKAYEKMIAENKAAWEAGAAQREKDRLAAEAARAEERRVAAEWEAHRQRLAAERLRKMREQDAEWHAAEAAAKAQREAIAEAQRRQLEANLAWAKAANEQQEREWAARRAQFAEQWRERQRGERQWIGRGRELGIGDVQLAHALKDALLNLDYEAWTNLMGDEWKTNV